VTGLVIGKWQQNPHPLTDHQKICHSDPYCCAKFGACGLLVKWVKYDQFFLFMSFLENSPTGQTHQQIFMLDIQAT